MRLHFREYGRGEPLIILHGLFGSLANWDALSRRLGSHFRVLALDQRNHGHSPHSVEMNYHVMAEDVREFMGAHGLARAHLLGHSMGGKTAMHFALHHSALVERLVVVDIAPRAYDLAHEHIFEALLSLNLKSFRARRELEDALAHAIPELSVRRFLLKNVARGHTGAFHWKINLRDILNNYRRLNEAVEARSAFDKPALFVRGDKSDYITDADKAALLRLFPRAKLRTVGDAGHWVHSDAPEKFVELTLEFLARDDSTAG
jgi:esterase